MLKVDCNFPIVCEQSCTDLQINWQYSLAHLLYNRGHMCLVTSEVYTTAFNA